MDVFVSSLYALVYVCVWYGGGGGGGNGVRVCVWCVCDVIKMVVLSHMSRQKTP